MATHERLLDSTNLGKLVAVSRSARTRRPPKDVRVIVVPGLGGSSERHWQSVWERRHDEWSRFQPLSWDQPDLADWRSALERAVGDSSRPTFLLAHSLGCILAFDFAARHPDRVAGLFLVAPPDPDAETFPAELSEFSAVAMSFEATPVPALAVTSTTDPYCSPERATTLCANWSAAQIALEDAGHINVPSGHGTWDEGYGTFIDYLHAQLLRLHEKHG